MSQDTTTGPREALSLKRAAYLLDVHEDTIRRWGKAGLIEIVRVGPKPLIRVPRSEIVRLRRVRTEGHSRNEP